LPKWNINLLLTEERLSFQSQFFGGETVYRLLLVDDEEDVREGVVREIDWEQCGFEVVAIAENGKEAQELIERFEPDLVVTDIKMPFMDGLQLAEWIRNKYPTIKTIILTGFDEFEYAQKAVKLHIDEYILKPFSARELIDVLHKVRGRMDEERLQKRNIEMLEKHYRESLPVLRGVFLTSLVTKNMTLVEIEEKASHYGLNLHGNHYGVSVLNIDPCLEEGASPANREPLNNPVLAKRLDKEQQVFAVLNITEEIVAKHQHGIVFMLNDNPVILGVSSERDRDAVMKKTLTVMEEIRQSIERYLKFTVTIGVGALCRDITDVIYSYEDAVNALDYRLILGTNRTICIDDVETKKGEPIRFDELKEHALTRCLKVGTFKELHEIVEQLFREIDERSISFKEYQIYLLEIITTILKAAKDANLDLDKLFGSNHVPIAELQKLNTLQETKNWIIGICVKIMNNIATDRQSSYKQLVEKAKEYTRQHFHETDISIQKVCGYLHISQGYFSSIFKKETKMTFVNYLLQVRMEAAKELLRTTDLKTFEIAEKVGYSDPNYFSFCFRKHCGMTPKEYRNSSRGEAS
jgi:two-component system response regulator YesN